MPDSSNSPTEALSSAGGAPADAGQVAPAQVAPEPAPAPEPRVAAPEAVAPDGAAPPADDLAGPGPSEDLARLVGDAPGAVVPPAVDPGEPQPEPAISAARPAAQAETAPAAPTSAEPAAADVPPKPAGAPPPESRRVEPAAAPEPRTASGARRVASLPAGTPAAELDHAGRRYGDVVALDDISLRVAPGTLLGVIGPSGAGKTTAIRLLTGGLRPTSGTARIMGEDPVHLRAATRERIGFMPQNVSLYDELTVAENLDFIGSTFGLFLPRRRRRIRAILQWLDLETARKRRASDLSGGMRRRLQLGCALVHDPDLVFLDEPTSGIDPIVRQTIWTELRRLRDAGRTVIMTTQIVPEAEECDLVALVSEGRLIALASPEDLRREAVGGDLLEVEMSDDVDAAALSRLAEVSRVEQVGRRRVRILAPDAATATPAVVDALQASGDSVVAVEVPRPSFDEVFVILVERARAAASAQAGAETGARPAA